MWKICESLREFGAFSRRRRRATHFERQRVLLRGFAGDSQRCGLGETDSFDGRHCWAERGAQGTAGTERAGRILNLGRGIISPSQSVVRRIVELSR